MQESSTRSLLVLLTVALICSLLVSISAVVLRPIQVQNELIERYRNIVSLTGLIKQGQELDDDGVLAVVQELDVRVVDLSRGELVAEPPPESVDARSAASDPTQSVAVPAEDDLARIGRRSLFEVVYLVWGDTGLSRLIVPIHGQGMWSTIYGFLALEADLNTVAAVSFYEQAETAGLGDQIQNADWQAGWKGRRLYGTGRDFRFRVASGDVADDSPAATHQVDGLSGATITANAVTALVRFWFGEQGYGPLLQNLADNPPVRKATLVPGETTGEQHVD